MSQRVPMGDILKKFEKKGKKGKLAYLVRNLTVDKIYSTFLLLVGIVLDPRHIIIGKDLCRH
jgi:hypothetical protein